MQLLELSMICWVRRPADNEAFVVRRAWFGDDVEVDVGDLLVGDFAVVLEHRARLAMSCE